MARIDDTQRVFDVSKPHKTSPSATSKPVIVGHRPMMADPMVKEEEKSESAMSGEAPKVTSVPVFTHESEPQPIQEHEHHELNIEPHMDPPSEPAFEPVEPKELPHQEQPAEEPHFTPLHSMLNEHDNAELVHDSHVKNDNEHLIGALPLPHPPGAGPKRRWKKILAWGGGAVLLLAVGAYLALDSGVVENDIELPFSIFGESEHLGHENFTQAPTDSDENSSNSPASGELTLETLPPFTLPSDWTEAEDKTANISFAYPKSWKLVKNTPGEHTITSINIRPPDYGLLETSDLIFMQEGGQFYIEATPTKENLELWRGSDHGDYFTAASAVKIDGMEALKGPCGHNNPSTCVYAVHDGKLYIFGYAQPARSIVLQETGKNPVTSENKYLQDYLKFLSSIKFTED